MKELRSGGHEQGISIGTPCALLTPAQLPVPVGFRPAARPNCGTREGSISRLENFKGAADTNTRAAENPKAVLMNFMMNGLVFFCGNKGMQGGTTVKLIAKGTAASSAG
jgi:hypothetical protein